MRVNALRCLGDLVPFLDKEGILGILETVRRCTAVDHSAPTLMCTLGVANAIYKQVSSLTHNFYCSLFVGIFPSQFYLAVIINLTSLSFIQSGVEFAAEYVIPLIFPLLTAHQLNVQQFAKYMLFVKDITRYYLIISYITSSHMHVN